MDGQLGESSRSPSVRDTPKSRLILPEWDVPPPKHLHASHDLITLLHLDELYNTYVRPFADPIVTEDDFNPDAAHSQLQSGLENGNLQVNGHPDSLDIKPNIGLSIGLQGPAGMGHLEDSPSLGSPIGVGSHARKASATSPNPAMGEQGQGIAGPSGSRQTPTNLAGATPINTATKSSPLLMNGLTPGQSKSGKKKKRKLEKGYTHLIDDCIDPVPLGEKPSAGSILGLISDAWLPPGPPPALIEEAIEKLPDEMFQVALLEPGHRQDGYSMGRKHGVAEAEERRKRKRARHSMSMAPPEIPSPGHQSPQNMSPADPSTPLLPVAPPTNIRRPSFPINTTRRGMPPNHRRGSSHSSPFKSMHSSRGGPPGAMNRGGFRGNNRGGGGGLAHRPGMRGGATFNGPNGNRGRGMPGPNRGGARFHRPQSFSGTMGSGNFSQGQKRTRESVGDDRDVKRSRE